MYDTFYILKMSEKVDFKKLEDEFQPDSIRASRIHKDLEALHTMDEFDDFIESNLAARMQYLQIGRLQLNPHFFTKRFRKSNFLPAQGILRNGRFALLQSSEVKDWEFFGNFNLGNFHYHLEGSDNGLTLSKNNRSPQPVKDTKLMHHFLHGVYHASTEDYSNNELVEWENDSSEVEISENIIDFLTAFYPSEKVSRTKLIRCPNGCGLMVSKNEITTKRTDVSDVAINIIQQNTPDKLLVYRFSTKLSINSMEPKTSDVSWQLIDGKLDQLDEYEDMTKNLDEDMADVIDPARNFEAWKRFMQIADDSLVYAMRET